MSGGKPKLVPEAILANLLIARLGWGKLVGRSRIKLSLPDVVVLECVRSMPDGAVVGSSLTGKLATLLSHPKHYHSFKRLGLVPWPDQQFDLSVERLSKYKLVHIFALPSGKRRLRISDKALAEFARKATTAARIAAVDDGSPSVAHRLTVERSTPSEE